MTLVDPYLLAERILDNVIRRAIIKEVIRLAALTSTYPSGYCVARIYNGTSSESPLRRLMVDMHMSCRLSV